MSSLLQNVEPHKPDFDKLVVIGKNMSLNLEETQTLETVSRTFSEVKNGRRKTSVYDSSLKCCLKINGVFFYAKSQSLSTSRKFHVIFEYDVQSLPLHTQYIVFENVGRVTIRIYWEKMEKFRLFRDITGSPNTDHFCFDKNMLILVPGQIVNFPIWFRTNKVCTVVETWEITTVPKFWEVPIRVFFVLQAQTHIENFMKRIKTLKSRIHQRVKKRIIKEILDDIMKKSKYQNYKTIDYVYYEPELFEAMNYDDSQPLRQPKYQYDQNIVEQLKKFYSEVRQSYHPKTWNLNVWDLQVLARVKDLIEYAEIRTSEFSQYRSLMATRSEMMGERRSRSTLELKSKPRLSALEIEEQSDPFLLKETKYGQLLKLLWKMAPPSITWNTERLKYFQVYSIFNAYFTLIDLELSEIKKFSVKPLESTQKPWDNFERLIFEKFDETQMIRTKRSFQEDTAAQPKPEILRDISTTDVERMHQLYFTSSPSEFILGKTANKLDKNAKSKSKIDDTRMSKSKASQVPSNLSRTTLEEMGLVQLDFDPYEEVQPFVKETGLKKQLSLMSQQTLQKADEEIGDGKEINYFNMYVIIYTYLSTAVDVMVDTLESSKEYKVPHENIEQLKACFKLFIDEKDMEEEERPINTFTNPEDRDYFEKILKAHLNEVTGQYLICAKTEPVVAQHRPVSFWGEDKELLHISTVPSVFSLHKPEPQEVIYKELGMQTVPTKEVYELETAVSYSSKDICECPSEFKPCPSLPSEMFYYSDDEVFLSQDKDCKRTDNIELSMKMTYTSSEELDTTEGSKKFSSVPMASISLIKEWNKKKCSTNELD